MPDQLDDEILQESARVNRGMDRSSRTPIANEVEWYCSNLDFSEPMLWKRRWPMGFYQAVQNLPLVSNDLQYIEFWNGLVMTTISYGSVTNVTASGSLGSMVMTGLPTGFASDNTNFFRLGLSDNIWSTTTGTNATDEGNTNTSFPHCTRAIYTSIGRMLALNGNTLYYANTGTASGAVWDRTVQLITLASGDPTLTMFNMIEWKPGLILVGHPSLLGVLDISNPSPTLWTFRILARFGFASTHPHGVVKTGAGDDVLFVGVDGIYSVNDLLAGRAGAVEPISQGVLDYMYEGVQANYYGGNEAIAGVTNLQAFLSTKANRNRTAMAVTNNILTVVCGEQVGYALQCDLRTRRWQIITSPSITRYIDVCTRPDNATGTSATTILCTRQNDPQTQWMARWPDGTITQTTEPRDDAFSSLAITPIIHTKAYSFGSLTNTKTGVMFQIHGLSTQTGSMTIDYLLDEDSANTGWINLGTFSLAATPYGSLITKKFSLANLGRWTTIRFRIKDDNTFVLNNVQLWRVVGWDVFATMNNLEES